MNVENTSTPPCWQADWPTRDQTVSGTPPPAPVDVCVIGAGVSGLSTAYLLAKAGKSVAVVDDGPVGGGESGNTTAHLSNAIDDRYVLIERLHGQEGAKVCADSHTAAIDLIESITINERIDCDFERLDGYLFMPPGGDAEFLQRELKAARAAGLRDVQMLSRAPISFDTGSCLRFPRQAQIHPLRYLTGLRDAFIRAGGWIHNRKHVCKVTKQGAAFRIEAEDGTALHAAKVVVATNTPVTDIVTIHTKQAPYRTYVIGARVPAGAVPPGLYWDVMHDTELSKEQYHYVRLQRLDRQASGGEELLIVGGEDHKTGQAADADRRWNALESWSRERFPAMGPVEHRWSGQVMEPVDCVAFIGPNPGGPDGLYIATGDSGMGMTHGTIAGILLTDLITGRRNDWAWLYDPNRKSIRAGWEFARENLNVAVQYADWFSTGQVASVSLIPPGEGAVVRENLKFIAAYRDDSGRLHKCSAICTHLGCIVAWNPAEKSWDCPCHGSRYDVDGKVLNGPAISGLKPVDRHVPVSR